MRTRYRHTRPDREYVNKAVLFIVSLVVSGVAAGILCGGTSLSNFLPLAGSGSLAVRALLVACSSSRSSGPNYDVI